MICSYRLISSHSYLSLKCGEEMEIQDIAYNLLANSFAVRKEIRRCRLTVGGKCILYVNNNQRQGGKKQTE